MESGLSPRARRDLERGIISGRFTGTDPTTVLSALVTLLSLVALRPARRDLDGDEAASDLAGMVLRMLGLPADDAHEVPRRPLPGLD